VSRVRIAERAVFEVLDGEAVILDLDSGRYFKLNPVGSRIWELIKEHGDISRVRDEVIAEFDVDDDRLAADLDVFVDRLRERGLIEDSRQ
jgi:hypothetical protein